MMHTRNTQKDAGFTLIEVLIAMFIFSLISIGATSALTNSIQAKDQIEKRLEAVQSFELSRILLKNDFSNVILRPNRDIFGEPEPYVLTGGVDSLINFTRAGRPNVGGLEARGDLQRISYHFENNAVIRRALLSENPGQQTSTKDRALYNNVTSAQMEFLSGDVASPQIFILTTDPIETAKPRLTAVRLEITFDNGDRLTQLFEVSLS